MKGVDSEKSYNYTDGRKNTGQKHCWKAGENRTVATIDNYTEVQPGSEPQLQAAVRLAPVAVVRPSPKPCLPKQDRGLDDVAVDRSAGDRRRVSSGAALQVGNPGQLERLPAATLTRRARRGLQRILLAHQEQLGHV